MENKKTNLTGIIASVILLIVFITASFAYFGMFTVNLENKVAVNIHASTIGDTSFIATSANLNVIVPTSGMFKGNTGLAAENTATLTVNLTGAPDVLTTCTYDVVYEYDLSSEIYGSTVSVTSGATKEITMQVDSPSGTNSYASETNFACDSTWTPKTTTVGAKKILVSGATITSEGTSVVQNINITGRYYNLEVDQAQLGNKSFTGKIYVENNNCTVGEITAKDIILAKNGGKDTIEAKGNPDFTTIATTNEGMYATEDDYTATTGMKSYYFRGAVDNNWLKFGKEGDKDIYWRIIRINGDGSIRMIYSGTTDPKTDSSVTGSNGVYMTGTVTQISESIFNSNYKNKKSEHVGYMYITGEQHGNSTSSDIKNTLENWYAETTLKDNVLVSQDQIFCNDRSASTLDVAYSNTNYTTLTIWNSTGTQYYYGAYGRLDKSKSPQLSCPTESDKFTSKDSSTGIGNKTLEYPVGLITADEVAMAGGKRSTDNSSYYLYTNQVYWTGSPTDFDSNLSFAEEFFVSSSGSLVSNVVIYTYGTRPVISLSSKAKLSGDGMWNNPYIVKN